MLKAQQEFSPDWFSKPSDSLLTIMNRRGVSVEAFANSVEGGMGTFRNLLTGAQVIDQTLATALSKAVGGSVGFWMKRQAGYEEALCRTAHADIENMDRWLSVPTPSNKPRGRLSQAQKVQQLCERLAFYGVNNLDTWHRRYGLLIDETQFRKSPTFDSNDAATSLWLRQGELTAAVTATDYWQPAKLRSLLQQIVHLSRIRHPHLFLPKLRSLAAQAGVAIAIVRAPKGCRASGASRMLTPQKAMVLLSFRHLSDDHFWFTLFHEFAHLLLHNNQTFIDTDDTKVDQREREANDFARLCIIPTTDIEKFEDLKPTRESILRFSIKLGIAPGLIVGQLQHRGAVQPDRFNYLKRRWQWHEIESASANL